jgi:hypothetical protein
MNKGDFYTYYIVLLIFFKQKLAYLYSIFDLFTLLIFVWDHEISQKNESLIRSCLKFLKNLGDLTTIEMVHTSYYED